MDIVVDTADIVDIVDTVDIVDIVDTVDTLDTVHTVDNSHEESHAPGLEHPRHGMFQAWHTQGMTFSRPGTCQDGTSWY